MILDGKKLAEEILARAKARAEGLSKEPTLRVISSGGNAATASYLKIKHRRAADAGVAMVVEEFDTQATTETLIEAITRAEENAIIVQLPLHESVDTQAVLDSIPIEKDADVLSDAARSAFELDADNALLPPVVGAVAEILKGTEVKGEKAAVVGAGWLVGAPVATWLRLQGAEVTALTIDSKPEDFLAALRAADLVVSGAGSPHLIKPEMIKDGVVLIDAGTSESSGKIAGDADPACADKCSLFTPVPGGVGPVAVAKLFENVVDLASRTKVA